MAYLFAVLAACANAASSVLQRKAGRQVPKRQNLSLRLVWSLAHEMTAGLAGLLYTLSPSYPVPVIPCPRPEGIRKASAGTYGCRHRDQPGIRRGHGRLWPPRPGRPRPARCRER